MCVEVESKPVPTHPPTHPPTKSSSRVGVGPPQLEVMVNSFISLEKSLVVFTFYFIGGLGLNFQKKKSVSV